MPLGLRNANALHALQKSADLVFGRVEAGSLPRSGRFFHVVFSTCLFKLVLCVFFQWGLPGRESLVSEGGSFLGIRCTLIMRSR